MAVTTYRTKDGSADYTFSMERTSDGWRAYIESQPSYNGRATDGHSTHRYNDGERKYICWSEPLRTESEARAVAARWADCTQEYIRTGKNF